MPSIGARYVTSPAIGERREVSTLIKAPPAIASGLMSETMGRRSRCSLPFRITGTAPLSVSTRANCCIVGSPSLCRLKYTSRYPTYQRGQPPSPPNERYCRENTAPEDEAESVADHFARPIRLLSPTVGTACKLKIGRASCRER